MSDFVADLLKEKGIYYRFQGSDLVIKCLNPEHEDTNPSLRVDKTTGIFHCFACGFKGNIFKYYGILTNQTFLKVAKLKNKIAQLKIDRDGLEVPPMAIPYSRSFRGITPATLKRFEAFYIPSSGTYMQGFEDRIIFPIKDASNKIRSFQGRHTLSSANPKYLIYPSNTSLSPYPVVLQGKFHSMVLVEGLFDMLNLQDKGLFNAVAVFGVSNLYKDIKVKLLPYKMQGITKIYIMFDGDDAGNKAADKLKPLLEEAEYEVEIIRLEDDTDPGGMSQEYVDSIKEYINAIPGS